MPNHLQIFSIGHSSHPMGTFLWLLDKYGIEALVDIRRYPGSTRHPHFNRASLSASLEDEGIEKLIRLCPAFVTAKRLKIVAQGQRRSRATLGIRSMESSEP